MTPAPLAGPLDALRIAIESCKDVTLMGRFSPAVDPVRWVAQLQAHLESLSASLASPLPAEAAPKGVSVGVREALERMVALYESEYDADAPFKRPDWLVAALTQEATPADMADLIAELDELVDTQIEDNLDYIRKADELMTRAAASLASLSARLVEVERERDACAAAANLAAAIGLEHQSARRAAEAKLAEAGTVLARHFPFTYDPATGFFHADADAPGIAYAPVHASIREAQ